MNLRVYLALLLLCGLVAGQDDGSADADAAADAGGEGGEGGKLIARKSGQKQSFWEIFPLSIILFSLFPYINCGRGV